MLAIISSLCSCKDITSCLTCSDEFKAVSMFSTWLSVSWATFLIRKKNTFIRNYILNKVLDISLTPTNNGAQSRSGWTEIEQIYENVHPKPALVQLFERTEVECGKRLFREDALQSRRQRGTFSCCFRRRLGVGSCLDYTSMQVHREYGPRQLTVLDAWFSHLCRLRAWPKQKLTHRSTRTGFVLFWAFQIPWLSMTFCMTSSSFQTP